MRHSHKRGWRDDPKTNGRALYGNAVKKEDIKDDIAIRYVIVDIGTNGGMKQVTTLKKVKGVNPITEKGLTPSKSIKRINISFDDVLDDSLVYIDNSAASRDASRLSDLSIYTTGVLVQFRDCEIVDKKQNKPVAIKKDEYLPVEADFVKAHDTLFDGDASFSMKKTLDWIEQNVINTGKNLKKNWRMITERNIKEFWLKNKLSTVQQTDHPENEIDLIEDEIEPTKSEVDSFNKQIGIPETSDEAEKELQSLSDTILNKPVEERIKTAKILSRNQSFSKLVKEMARYTCEICSAPPFEQKNGVLYAEAHHKYELAKYRIDDPRQMICVCPTCHRVLHYGSDRALEERQKVKNNF